MKANWLTSDVLDDLNDWEIRISGGVLIGFFWLFVSMFLDTLTPTPTAVWVGLWIAVPTLWVLFPSIALLHPANRMNDHNPAAKALVAYYNLSKDERKLFPANTEKALRDRSISWEDRNRLAQSVTGTIREINQAKALRAGTGVTNLIESIEQTRKSVAIETNTFKEFS